MLTDIVRSLRAPIEYPNGLGGKSVLSPGTTQRIMCEGADEIVRLRAAFVEAARMLTLEQLQELSAESAKVLADMGLLGNERKTSQSQL